MALDEYLFGKLANFFKSRKKILGDNGDQTVCLTDIKERLTILARAITGKAIDIFPAEREGGYKQHNFFLPTEMALFQTYEQNLSFYFFRLLYLAVQQELKLNWYLNYEPTLEEAQHRAHEVSPVILTKLFADYPITEQWHTTFIEQLLDKTTKHLPTDYTFLYGKWMQSPLEDNTIDLHHVDEGSKQSSQQDAKTIMLAKAVEEIKSITIDKKQQEDYVMTHNFEKVETAEEHNGVWRDFDGDDELKDHQQALDELNMKLVVRVDDAAHSIYHADFIENTNVAESTALESVDFHYEYPEWNESKNEYRNHYCKVYPINMSMADAEYYRKTISENATTLQGLRKMLTSVNNKLQQQRRQSDGPEFELDALCDMYVDIHTKRSPNENIYLSSRKKEKDISILMLLDVSLSSDAYAAGNRVIDVEKQVSILFGEILEEYRIDFGIYGFYSKTRNFSNFITLKDFDTSWQLAKHQIGAIQPSGYTRIGAALRHAGFLLQQRQTKNKWVILLSDGKPNDYDKYEGKYGIQDVKRALYELKSTDINAYALAIESEAKYYLPQMFGQNHYQILTTPVELLQSLVTLYERLKY